VSTIDVDRLREGVAYFDRWIGYQQQLKEVPGVVVAVRYEDQLLLSKGYGFADLERQIPMTPQHVFRIASHSKTFTATAIMQLVEAGKLRLDDELGRYIPWLRGGPAKVTIRQALNHSAGIVRDGNDADYWQLERDFPDAEELQRMVEEGGEVLPANESFKYSNIGFSLLGLVIEAVTGEPYNAYVKREIVDRLGLPDTGPETDDHARERLVTGYTPRVPDFPQAPIADVETGAMSPATGFYSTAEDLCRYASAHFLGNEELLSDASKREMQQPYWEIENEDGSHYGLGFAVMDIGDRRMVGHGGGFPGHSTRTWFDPKDRLVVVVLTNQTGGPAGSFAEVALRIMDSAVGKSGISGEQSPEELDRFAGRFVTMWGAVDIVRFGGEMMAVSPADDRPMKYATELAVVDEATLCIGKTSGYGSPGELVRYFRDVNGHVTKIVMGGMSMYPLDSDAPSLPSLPLP
jgi:CubicO group peptidase (beta-lactamase class C family)